MVDYLANRTRKILKKQGVVKAARTLVFLGCTAVELQSWLTSRFTDGMTMENHGSVWDIDHVIPCSAWDLTKPDHVRACFHWTNLQPLLKVENRWIKGGVNRYAPGHFDAAIAERLMVLRALGM